MAWLCLKSAEVFGDFFPHQMGFFPIGRNKKAPDGFVAIRCFLLSTKLLWEFYL